MSFDSFLKLWGQLWLQLSKLDSGTPANHDNQAFLFRQANIFADISQKKAGVLKSKIPPQQQTDATLQ